MVKCAKLNIALRGKSTLSETLESLGHRLKARVAEDLGKCVPERSAPKKVTNESGTAAKTASYAHGGYRGLFYFNSHVGRGLAPAAGKSVSGGTAGASPRPTMVRCNFINNHIGGNLYVSV